MEPNNSEDEMLRRFVEQTARESGIELDIEKTVEAISRKIDEQIVEALPESTMDKMLELNQRGEASDDKINALLDESGVDPQPIVRRVLMAFREMVMERKEA